MFSSGNRSPLFVFESANYPDGKRQSMRFTVGNTAIIALVVILGLLVGTPLSKILETAKLWSFFLR